MCIGPLSWKVMGLLKTLVKLLSLSLLVASLAGVAMLVKRPKNSDPVTYDEWPPVPQNPSV
jgi:hypothetical protein